MRFSQWKQRKQRKKQMIMNEYNVVTDSS